MYYTDRLGSFNITCCNTKIAERGARKGTKLNQTVLYYSALRHCLKVGFSSFKKNRFICFNKSPLKMMKNAFHFILKVLLVLKVFTFLCWLFGHVEKTAGLEQEC